MEALVEQEEGLVLETSAILELEALVDQEEGLVLEASEELEQEASEELELEVLAEIMLAKSLEEEDNRRALEALEDVQAQEDQADLEEGLD